MTERPYTGISLFSGIAGIDLAFSVAGFEITDQVEINAFCRKVLAKHAPEFWPSAKVHEDVRDCHGAAYLDSLVRTWYLPSDGVEYNQTEIEMAGKLKKLTPAQAEECVRLYDSGLACGPIAQYFGVSRNAMYDLLKRRTVMRSNLRYGEDNHFYRGGKTANDHAQNMVEYAIRIGALIPQSACEQCGSQAKFKDGRKAIQAHHCDYNKPLEVMWLCQKCHHKWHKENVATRKEVQQELPDTTVIFGGFP